MPTTLTQRDAIPVASDEDVVRVRQIVRSAAQEAGFNLVDQTKIITAASELARNTLIHGGGGSVSVRTLDKHDRLGVEITFVDEGPGIPDIDQALEDGFTTGSGMGLGLGGAKRLVNQFDIESGPEGTRVSIIRWTR